MPFDAKICDNVMLLGAGYGKRLHPLTLSTPKPLIEIHGELLLEYHLRHIQAARFSKAIVNTHYLTDQIERYLKKHAVFPYSISHEETLLETGGGITKALPHFDRPFLSVNSDAYTDGDLAAFYTDMLETFDLHTMDAMLMLAPRENVLGYNASGDFFYDKGEITFRDDRDTAPYVYVGIQILNPKIFESWEGAFPISKLWRVLQERGRLFGWIENQAIWFDTGNHEGLRLARSLNVLKLRHG